MKLRCILFPLVWAIGLWLPAQVSLRSELNMFRTNDTIIKQQVEYKHPGKTGTGVFWNFGKLKAVDEKYRVIYSDAADSSGIITGTEHRTRYYYRLRNDSLLLHGYENPTTRVTYRMPETVLRFPMRYGDKIEGCYGGKGVYCDRLDVEAYGTSTSTVDACGVLILPGGDTLRHVIRVRTLKVISEKILPLSPDSLSATAPNAPFPSDAGTIRDRLNADTALLAVETCRWYAAGYRYPVFETVRTGNYRDNKTASFATAFFYRPQEHTYTKTDKENRALQDSLRNAPLADASGNPKAGMAERNHTPSGIEPEPTEEDIRFSYNIYPNPVESQLAFEFFLSQEATVSYALYGITGGLVYRKPPRKLPPDAYADTIDMSRLFRGEYILSIQADEKVYSEKILKK